MQNDRSPGQLRAQSLCAKRHLDRDAAYDERVALLEAVQVEAVADAERQRRRRRRRRSPHRRRLDHRRCFDCGRRRRLHDCSTASCQADRSLWSERRRARQMPACFASWVSPSLHAASVLMGLLCVLNQEQASWEVAHTAQLSDGAEADSCCPAQQLHEVNAGLSMRV